MAKMFGKMPDPAPGKQVAQSVEVKTESGEAKTIHYWLFLPQNYDAKTKAPLLLFLHGAGERGDQLDFVKKHGPPKIVESKPEFPCITVSPQCAAGSRWTPKELTQLLDAVQKQHAVDESRVYLTGLSMGGFGTWSLAAAAPERFAAIVPICGGGNPETAEKFKDIPCWVFHGAKDTAVKQDQSDRMVEALKKAGGAPKYTIYPEAGHDSWTETYNNPELYHWLLAQKKTSAGR